MNPMRLWCLSALLCFTAAAHVAAQDIDAILKASADFNAVQVIYRNGVPHTDKTGNILHEYDPEPSFFQIAILCNPYGTVFGYDYDLSVLTEAGFNTMWPWAMRTLENQLEAGREAGLQVINMKPVETEEIEQFKDHPNWLGTVWMDEPTGALWGKNMEEKFEEFVAYRKLMNELAPGRVVFINDVPWISAPATSWWVRWNTAGDVSCHDNYPIMTRKQRSRTISDWGVQSGIPETVSFAVAVNNEEKPVWLIVGSFASRGHGAFPFRMPTPMELRAQVYAALIHGATGIIYFCQDTYVCRDGKVIGMSHDPQAAYLEGGPGRPNPTPATPMELAQSRAMWEAATFINQELHELTPVIFSPTVSEDEVRYSLTSEGEPVSLVPLRCLLKPHPEGGYVLLTVNLDDAVMKATYEFPAGLASVQPMFENRLPYELEPGQTTFEDMYDPFEVHVYHITLQQ